MTGADRAALDPEGFAAATGVSRETLARLERYAELLRHWQRAINLVAASTLPDLWRRHMLDSAQLYPLLPPAARILVDLGSGAGFPGLVLAIMGVAEVHLIEADQRKAAFLREAARITGTAATIHACAIERAPEISADAIVARALAPLEVLLGHARRFARPDTVCLFLKGREVDAELTTARDSWIIEVERFPSLTESGGTILRLGTFPRARF